MVATFLQSFAIAVLAIVVATMTTGTDSECFAVCFLFLLPFRTKAIFLLKLRFKMLNVFSFRTIKILSWRSAEG